METIITIVGVGFGKSKILAIGWVGVTTVENNDFSGPNPQVFPTGPSVAIKSGLSRATLEINY